MTSRLNFASLASKVMYSMAKNSIILKLILNRIGMEIKTSYQKDNSHRSIFEFGGLF